MSESPPRGLRKVSHDLKKKKKLREEMRRESRGGRGAGSRLGTEDRGHSQNRLGCMTMREEERRRKQAI